MIQTTVIADLPDRVVYMDAILDDATQQPMSRTLRTVWKPGTPGYNEQQIRDAIATEVTAIAAEAGRLRDTTVVFSTQQLRNDLARLGDDVAKLGRLALGLFDSA